MKHTEPPSDDDGEVPPAPDLVDVVDRTALIENIVNQIITDYCAPRKEAWEFMWSVVLDTSVMPLGTKAKVVMAIAQELNFKLKKDPLHKIIALRNSFAHNATDAHPMFVVRNPPEKSHSYLQFWVLDSSGKIQKIKRKEAFEEFNAQYRLARDSLALLRNLVRESVRAQ